MHAPHAGWRGNGLPGCRCHSLNPFLQHSLQPAAEQPSCLHVGARAIHVGATTAPKPTPASQALASQAKGQQQRKPSGPPHRIPCSEVGRELHLAHRRATCARVADTAAPGDTRRARHSSSGSHDHSFLAMQNIRLARQKPRAGSAARGDAPTGLSVRRCHDRLPPARPASLRADRARCAATWSQEDRGTGSGRRCPG